MVRLELAYVIAVELRGLSDQPTDHNFNFCTCHFGDVRTLLTLVLLRPLTILNSTRVLPVGAEHLDKGKQKDRELGRELLRIFGHLS